MPRWVWGGSVCSRGQVREVVRQIAPHRVCSTRICQGRTRCADPRRPGLRLNGALSRIGDVCVKWSPRGHSPRPASRPRPIAQCRRTVAREQVICPFTITLKGARFWPARGPKLSLGEQRPSTTKFQRPQRSARWSNYLVGRVVLQRSRHSDLTIRRSAVRAPTAPPQRDRSGSASWCHPTPTSSG